VKQGFIVRPAGITARGTDLSNMSTSSGWCWVCPPALIDCALPYLTVYSGQAGVNVFGAAPEVLSALPGITPERLRPCSPSVRDNDTEPFRMLARRGDIGEFENARTCGAVVCQKPWACQPPTRDSRIRALPVLSAS
jgi:hypothetical protein